MIECHAMRLANVKLVGTLIYWMHVACDSKINWTHTYQPLQMNNSNSKVLFTFFAVILNRWISMCSSIEATTRLWNIEWTPTEGNKCKTKTKFIKKHTTQNEWKNEKKKIHYKYNHTMPKSIRINYKMGEMWKTHVCMLCAHKPTLPSSSSS